MLMPLRHLVSILLLPCVVVVLVPVSLLRRSPASLEVHGDSLWPWLHVGAGVAVFVTGFAVFAWSVGLFARVGRGTLAPWDPTRNLVAMGPYRYMRNPMISGVVLMLLGEAVFWWSRPVGLWAAAFLLFNHVYFVALEEPGLEHRFGAAYRAYKASVPRWVPRLPQRSDK